MSREAGDVQMAAEGLSPVTQWVPSSRAVSGASWSWDLEGGRAGEQYAGTPMAPTPTRTLTATRCFSVPAVRTASALYQR